MKNKILIIVAVFVASLSYSQEMTKEYYDNGQLKAIGKGKNPWKHKPSLNPKLDGYADNGEWRFYYESGQLKHIGNYKKFYRDGLHKSYYKNGTLELEATYHLDKPYGEWKEYYDNGNLKVTGAYEKYDGMFSSKNKSQKKIGVWKEYYKNGNLKTKGSYAYDMIRQNERDGIWQFYYSNGKLEKTGLFKEGNAVGEWKNYNEDGVLNDIIDLSNDYIKFYYPSGQIGEEGPIKKGRQGEWRVYYESGNLRATQNYVNDKLNGRTTEYYENGQIGRVGNILNEMQEGEWKEYTDSGQLYAIKTFKEGKLDGPFKQYNASGNVSIEGILINQLQDGEWKEYYENGSNFRIVQFNNGKKEGIWKDYHTNGQIGRVYRWENDKFMEVLEFNDKNGNPLDPGTLKNGNGKLNEYNEEGELIKQLTVKDGVIIQE
jgi:antitoxin component YwqK of YwqJK toxin-antitoxin module